MELCRQAQQRPLPNVCVRLPSTLDIITDRVKLDDWGPILQALSLDRDLHSISIRCRFQNRKHVEENISQERIRGTMKVGIY